jgi:HlyD family secretion protein
MPRAIRNILFILLAVGVIALSIWYYTRPKPIKVTIQAVERADIEKTVTNTRAGTVKSCRRAGLTPATGGQISSLNVHEGDKVQAGQLLLEIWNLDLKAELYSAQQDTAAARARAEQACVTATVSQNEARRMSALRKKNLASEEDAERASGTALANQAACNAARSSIKVSEAKSEVINSQLERTFLRAPFSGTVAEVNGEVGEFVTPSPVGIPTLPAIDLVTSDCLYIQAPIDEVDAPDLKPGMPVRITLDAFKKTPFPGKLRRIAPYVQDREKQARTVDVEADFTDTSDVKNLLPGYSADVEIILQTKTNVLRIPTEAIQDQDKVFVYHPDTHLLEQRKIKTGISNWNYTEVVSGLSANEKLVTSLDRKGVEDGALVAPE